MKEEQTKLIEFIQGVRDYDTFYIQLAKSALYISDWECRKRMSTLYGIGAIKPVRGSKTKYVVADNAIQLIVNSQREVDKKSKPKVVKKVDRFYDFDCSMVVVSKANVADMGNPFLKLFDSLLTGVRA